jgi:putative oxidoreductase
VFRQLSGSVKDIAILVARVLLGVVLFAHGFEKVFLNGFDYTSSHFSKIGVPLAPLSAAYASIVEIVGGCLLTLGAGTVVVSVLAVIDMIGASLTTGSFAAIFVQNHGFELEGTICAGLLLLLVVGAGRFSLDHVLFNRRSASTTQR